MLQSGNARHLARFRRGSNLAAEFACDPDDLADQLGVARGQLSPFDINIVLKTDSNVSAREHGKRRSLEYASQLRSIRFGRTDYNLPGMPGLEVAQALREIRADLPVVLASGYITEELRAKAPAAGIRELIYKPNTVDDLCEAAARFANAQVEIPS